MPCDSIGKQNHINIMMKSFFLLKPARLLFEPTEIDFCDTVNQTLNGFTRAPVIVGGIGAVIRCVRADGVA
jgi:hypothetical protein